MLRRGRGSCLLGSGKVVSAKDSATHICNPFLHRCHFFCIIICTGFCSDDCTDFCKSYCTNICTSFCKPFCTAFCTKNCTDDCTAFCIGAIFSCLNHHLFPFTPLYPHSPIPR